LGHSQKLLTVMGAYREEVYPQAMPSQSIIQENLR